MRFWTIAVIALLASSHPALAQKGRGHGKGHAADDRAVIVHEGPRYHVKNERAIVVTREVLVHRGYLVERVEQRPEVTLVWYRRGDMGNGRGRGPLEMMVIRRYDDVVVFEQAPPAVLVDLDVKLKL